VGIRRGDPLREGPDTTYPVEHICRPGVDVGGVVRFCATTTRFSIEVAGVAEAGVGLEERMQQLRLLRPHAAGLGKHVLRADDGAALVEAPGGDQAVLPSRSWTVPK